MIRTLPFLAGALLLSTLSFAQVNETFENNYNTLSSNCWILDQVKQGTRSIDPAYVITGDGSIYSEPPVNSTQFRSLATPFLNMRSGPVSISFNYKLSSKLSKDATRIIELGILDKSGSYTFLNKIDVSTAIDVTFYTFTAHVTAGAYRLMIKMGGTKGDGNCRIVIDDLEVSAPYQYRKFCNEAPVAKDDSYTTAKASIYKGVSVLGNDKDPNGEKLFASVVTPSKDGQVQMNPDGSFTFTPNSDFDGTSTTFEYKVTDDGYTPASSNVAKVTIRFVEAKPELSRHITFSGRVENKKAVLQWNVEENESLNYVEVQRSTDGNRFEGIKTVKATSKAGLEVYKEQDLVINSKLQYRLKIVCNTGAESYSKVILLHTDETAANTINIIGNPVTTSLTLHYNALSAGTVTVSIKNNMGINVSLAHLSANKGTNLFKIDTFGNLKPGTYVVNIINNKGESSSSLFMKI